VRAAAPVNEIDQRRGGLFGQLLVLLLESLEADALFLDGRRFLPPLAEAETNMTDAQIRRYRASLHE
jgi:hypothetical protein